MKAPSASILAGDVGGTKTVLGIFSMPQADTPGELVRSAHYPSREFEAFEDILQLFLADQTDPISLACFDVAGPVVAGRAQITNLPWVIEQASLAGHLGAPVLLVNDMQAIAMAVGHAGQIRTASLQAGQPENNGKRAVLAPGTGLGEGFLVWSHGRCLPFGTEGGHTDFGPRTPLQIRLLDYLQSSFEHVSYERVCSGLGIQNLYAFLRDYEKYPEPEWLRMELEGALDPTPVIVQAALQARAPICSRALELFVEILGSEAGNLALKTMATGGVYLAGGLPRRILPRLQTAAFLEAFRGKGRFCEILSRIPLQVVLEPEAALLGAAWMGAEALAGGPFPSSQA